MPPARARPAGTFLCCSPGPSRHSREPPCACIGPGQPGRQSRHLPACSSTLFRPLALCCWAACLSSWPPTMAPDTAPEVAPQAAPRAAASPTLPPQIRALTMPAAAPLTPPTAAPCPARLADWGPQAVNREQGYYQGGRFDARMGRRHVLLSRYRYFWSVVLRLVKHGAHKPRLPGPVIGEHAMSRRRLSSGHPQHGELEWAYGAMSRTIVQKQSRNKARERRWGPETRHRPATCPFPTALFCP